jgi:hypothetical protein
MARDVKAAQVGSGGWPSLIGKTEMSVFAQNNVIQEATAQELSTVAQLLGGRDPLGWAWDHSLGIQPTDDELLAIQASEAGPKKARGADRRICPWGTWHLPR